MNQVVSNRTEDYLAAHKAASDGLKCGDFKAYSTTHDRMRGRMIHVETDQGWDPEPMFQEFDEEGFPPQRRNQ